MPLSPQGLQKCNLGAFGREGERGSAPVIYQGTGENQTLLRISPIFPSRKSGTIAPFPQAIMVQQECRFRLLFYALVSHTNIGTIPYQKHQEQGQVPMIDYRDNPSAR